MKALVRALPDVVRMVNRLLNDPVLARPAKIAIAAAAVYLVSPIDLIPDFIPVLGYVDDLVLAAILVDGIVTYVDRQVLLRYWPGSPRSLDQLARAAGLLARWVPRRIRARIFAPRG
jgi:uncharacterized membrane protein YkvA (DUF1232 family)